MSYVINGNCHQHRGQFWQFWVYLSLHVYRDGLAVAVLTDMTCTADKFTQVHWGKGKQFSFKFIDCVSTGNLTVSHHLSEQVSIPIRKGTMSGHTCFISSKLILTRCNIDTIIKLTVQKAHKTHTCNMQNILP